MNRYVGTWKLDSIASFDEQNNRKYISVEAYLAEAGDNEEEKRDRQRTIGQLGTLEITTDNLAFYKCRFADFGMTRDSKEAQDAIKDGQIKVIDDEYFTMGGRHDETLHCQLRGDDLWMDFDQNSSGKCFAKATCSEDPALLQIMIMFRYRKVA